MSEVKITEVDEHDNGRVVIKNWSMFTKKIEIVINNNSFFYDREFHTFTPTCNCPSFSESDCRCTHLPTDYWY